MSYLVLYEGPTGDVRLWCVCSTREKAEAEVRHNPYRWIQATGHDYYREKREDR